MPRCDSSWPRLKRSKQTCAPCNKILAEPLVLVDRLALQALQAEYLRSATELWNGALGAATVSDAPRPVLKDRRFAGAEWSASPSSAYAAQMYLLNARTLMQMAESLEADPKTKARVRFAV